MFKDFPLNFKITTWRMSQWIATITFIMMVFSFRGQMFGYIGDITFYFTTPIGFLAILAVVAAQLYTYGGYITNTSKDITVPLLIILFCCFLDIVFAYLANNIGYVANWKAYLYRYLLLSMQNLILLWVYYDVEYVEISKEDLDKLSEYSPVAIEGDNK